LSSGRSGCSSGCKGDEDPTNVDGDIRGSKEVNSKVVAVLCEEEEEEGDKGVVTSEALLDKGCGIDVPAAEEKGNADGTDTDSGNDGFRNGVVFDADESRVVSC
jgi:hypothetical protein